MSRNDLLAVATLSFCAELRDAFAALPGAPQVMAASPWNGPDHGASVHLHAFAPAPGVRNAPAPGMEAPRALQLRYLLSFFGPDDLCAHRLAGRAAELILERPVVTGEALARAAEAAGLDSAGLHGTGQMRLLLEGLTISDMTQLWQRFAPMRYALSLGVACEIIA